VTELKNQIRTARAPSSEKKVRLTVALLMRLALRGEWWICDVVAPGKFVQRRSFRAVLGDLLLLRQGERRGSADVLPLPLEAG
jgi:hypothetical protein